MGKEKKRIAVLFGGCSSEYKISLQSAYAVIENLDRQVYEPILIGITQQGEWLYFDGHTEKILSDTWAADESCRRAIISPSRDVKGVLVFEKRGIRTIQLDAGFPVLHGKNGEDGTVQGLLELAGIPVVGCGMLSSALCMDKWMAHVIVKNAGIRVPRGLVIKEKGNEEIALAAAREIGYPIFVKPVNAGSSLGINKVCDDVQLLGAVWEAFHYDGEVILEETIEGFEVGCAVLGNEELLIGAVDEIEIHQEFFDYVEKYTQENSKIHTPARIPKELAEEIKDAAARIYRALNCKGYARIDMFLTPEREIIFNEVNTIPGFTAHSRFPNMLKKAGLSYREVVDKLIDLAVSE